jgi:hypothetical protein
MRQNCVNIYVLTICCYTEILSPIVSALVSRQWADRVLGARILPADHGSVRLIVGFHVEPAFEDSFNAVDVILSTYDGAWHSRRDRARTARPARERCLGLVENSIGLVTALGPVLGYEACSRVARRALDERRTIAEVVLEEGLLTEARLNELVRLEAMTRPSRIIMAAVTKPKR